jgi:hypothetical protein
VLGQSVTYKGSELVASSLERMAEPDIVPEIVHV